MRIVDDFHPDLRHVARWLPRAAVGPRTLRPIRLLSGLPARMPARGVEVKTVAAISVRVHRPAPSEHPLPALLWIHGGGYVIGTAAQDDALCRRFAQELGIIVAAVDYRLAPEQQFPVLFMTATTLWPGSPINRMWIRTASPSVGRVPAADSQLPWRYSLASAGKFRLPFNFWPTPCSTTVRRPASMSTRGISDCGTPKPTDSVGSPIWGIPWEAPRSAGWLRRHAATIWVACRRHGLGWER